MSKYLERDYKHKCCLHVEPHCLVTIEYLFNEFTLVSVVRTIDRGNYCYTES